MVNSTPVIVTPILKRARTISVNGSSTPAAKRMGHDPIGLKLDGVMERLSAPGCSLKEEVLGISEASEDVQKSWLSYLASNINALTPNASVKQKDDPKFLFTLQCINMNWKLEKGEGIRNAYSRFLCCLCTGQLDYVKHIIRRLFEYFIKQVKDDGQFDKLTEPHKLEDEEIKVINCAIDILCTILSKIPMCETWIVEEARSSRPYFKKHPHTQVIYNSCLLLLCQRLPKLSTALFTVVLNSLLKLDIQCDSSSLDEEEEDAVFAMEVDDSEAEAKKLETHLKFLTMDKLLETVILYVHCTMHATAFTLDRAADLAALRELGCLPGTVRKSPSGVLLGCGCGAEKHDPDAVRSLYSHLLDFFRKFLLKTHSSEYTQFVIFYFLSVRPGYVWQFLNSLLDKFRSFSEPADVRANAMAYVGSLLVRGKFISFKLVQNTIETVSNWCRVYVNKHKDATNNFANADTHKVFYCACQTLFYVITFKCEAFSSSLEAITFVRNLSIGNLIYSGLNPLAVCSPAIVENFAGVAHHYEIAVCTHVIVRNKRNTIPVVRRNEITSITGNAVDVNFPFDPLPSALSSSNLYVEPFFQEFKGLPEEVTARIAAKNEAKLPREDSMENTSIVAEPDEDDFINDGSFTSNGLPMMFCDT